MPLRWPLLLLLFAAALALEVRIAGTDACLWMDTATDQRAVLDCLEADRCPLYGPTTSVGDVRIGVAWIGLRTAAEAVGLGAAGFQLVLVVLDALALVLAAAGAAALAGPAAGLATALALPWLGPVLPAVDTLYMNRLLLFTGAASLVTVLAAARTGRLRHLLAAAAFAAIATELHVVHCMLLPPVLWVAARRSRPWTGLALALATFGGLLLAAAPGTWIFNLERLVTGLGLKTQASLGEASGPGVFELALWTAVPAGLWLVLGSPRGSGVRRLAAAALASVVPMAALYAWARATRSVGTSPHYLVPWVVAAVALLAAAAVEAARRAARRLAPRQVDGAAPAPHPRLRDAVLIVACAALAALPVEGRRHVDASVPGLRTFSEARALAAALQARGWTFEDVTRGLATPVPPLAIEGLSLEAGWTRDGPRTAGRRAVVIRTARGRLPDPLPPGWAVLVDGPDGVLAGWLGDGWLDWGDFSLCRGTPPACVPSGVRTSWPADRARPLARVAGVPVVDGATPPFPLVLRVPVRLPAGGPPRDLVLPRIARDCCGRIVAVPPGSTVAPDGLSARLDPGAGATGEVAFEWVVNGPDCPVWTFMGQVPFVLEAPPEDAAQLRDLLENPGGAS